MAQRGSHYLCNTIILGSARLRREVDIIEFKDKLYYVCAVQSEKLGAAYIIQGKTEADTYGYSSPQARDSKWTVTADEIFAVADEFKRPFNKKAALLLRDLDQTPNLSNGTPQPPHLTARWKLEIDKFLGDENMKELKKISIARKGVKIAQDLVQPQERSYLVQDQLASGGLVTGPLTEQQKDELVAFLNKWGSEVSVLKREDYPELVPDLDYYSDWYNEIQAFQRGDFYFNLGDRVRTGDNKIGEISGVEVDEDLDPIYTVDLDDGSEKQYYQSDITKLA